MATTDERKVSGMNLTLGHQSGSIEPGETVVNVRAPNDEALVTRVIIHPGDRAPKCPVRGTFVVEVQTEYGSRWIGADAAYIGSDLRVHWSRA